MSEQYGWWKLVPKWATVKVTDPENGIMEITGPGAHHTTVVLRVNAITNELLGVWAFY